MPKASNKKAATKQANTKQTKRSPADKGTKARTPTAAHTTATSGAASTARAAPRPDPLTRKAADVKELLSFVDSTSFAGDEREAADELSAVDQHPADIASMTLQRETDYTVKQVLEDDARQIQEALRRKQAGTYGICANCGKQIPKARLEARPEAIYCIECQRLHEGSSI